MKIIELDNAEIDFVKKCVIERLKYTTNDLGLNSPDEKVSKSNYNFYIVPLKTLLDKLAVNRIELSVDENRKIISCMNEQITIIEQSNSNLSENFNLIHSILDKCNK